MLHAGEEAQCSAEGRKSGGTEDQAEIDAIALSMLERTDVARLDSSWRGGPYPREKLPCVSQIEIVTAFGAELDLAVLGLSQQEEGGSPRRSAPVSLNVPQRMQGSLWTSEKTSLGTGLRHHALVVA